MFVLDRSTTEMPAGGVSVDVVAEISSFEMEAKLAVLALMDAEQEEKAEGIRFNNYFHRHAAAANRLVQNPDTVNGKIRRLEAEKAELLNQLSGFGLERFKSFLDRTPSAEKRRQGTRGACYAQQRTVEELGIHRSPTNPRAAAAYGSLRRLSLTPLGWATANNDRALVSQLLEAGYDPAARGEQGYTPFFIASMLGYVEIMDILQRTGDVHIGATINGGADPAAAAIEYGQVEALTLILWWGWRPANKHWVHDQNIADLCLEAGPDCCNEIGMILGLSNIWTTAFIIRVGPEPLCSSALLRKLRTLCQNVRGLLLGAITTPAGRRALTMVTIS